MVLGDLPLVDPPKYLLAYRDDLRPRQEAINFGFIQYKHSEATQVAALTLKVDQCGLINDTTVARPATEARSPYIVTLANLSLGYNYF